jgi:hypothetical protein
MWQCPAATAGRYIVVHRCVFSVIFSSLLYRLRRNWLRHEIAMEDAIFLLSLYSFRPHSFLSVTSIIALSFPLSWIIPLRMRYHPSRSVCFLYQDKQDKGHRTHICHSFLSRQFSPETVTPVVRKHRTVTI